MSRAEQNRRYYLKQKARRAAEARTRPARPAPPAPELQPGDKWDGRVYCLRCETQLVETVEATERRPGEPPMNLHTYRCPKAGCVPGRGRKILHGDRAHVCHPHPDPDVLFQVRLPQVMARPEVILAGKVGAWDDPLGDLEGKQLRGEVSRHREKPWIPRRKAAAR